MSVFELEVIHNLNIMVVQGWIIIALLVGCLIALWVMA